MDFGFDSVAATAAPLRSGALRALAGDQRRRAAALPQVPTLREAGMPDYDLGVWLGLFAATRTPPAALRRLGEALEQTRTAPIAARLRAAQVDPLAVPRPALAAWIRASAGRWQAIARDAGIAID